MIDLIFEYNAYPCEKIKKLYDVSGATAIFGSDIANFYTSNANVIEKRQRIFRSIFKTDGLFEALERIYDKTDTLLSAYDNAHIGINRASNETALNSICTVNSYISFIEESFRELRCFDLDLCGLSDLYAFVKEQNESRDFAVLKENMKNISENIRYAKSVTVGINLDSNMRVLEAGLVSVNSEPYRSADFFDKLFRNSFNEPKDFECLAPISVLKDTVSREDIAIINHNLNKALDGVFHKQLKKIDDATKEYMEKSCEKIKGLRESLLFYLRAVCILREYKNKGVPICLATVSKGKEYSVSNLYNIRIVGEKGIENTVPNSFEFDDNGRMYVLTGANSGGKTVFLESLVLAQVLFQTGLPIFAEKATMFTVDNIHIFYAQSSNADSKIFGRFETEVRWFSDNIKECGERDLFIMDELYSGTSSTEANEIALTTMKKIIENGGYGIFSTHIFDLARFIKENESNEEYSFFDNMHIKTDGDKHLYKVLRGAPEHFESRAMNIAKKYGIV